MCGIVGYNGPRQAAPILLEGLSRLEYRGYDSAGLAVRSGGAPVRLAKAKGRLRALYEKTQGGAALPGDCGIGHTRWATHGEPSEENAHPHCSDDRLVVGVHNGIIENHRELKETLEKNGYAFLSQTDTEVAIKLLHHYYLQSGRDPIRALRRAMMRIRGSYALAILFEDRPEAIYAARKDSPLILGVGEGEGYLASDVPAILPCTRSVYYMGNLEIACLGRGEARFYNVDGEELHKSPTRVAWDAAAAEKGGFEHFMMKEIHEQPRAVEDTLASVTKEGRVDLSGAGLSEEALRQVRDICIVACGSAYHAGVAAQYVIEELAHVSVRVELASEFRYRGPLLGAGSLVMVISQSGETADSLAALREAKGRGTRTLGVVNVVGSSIAREADSVLYTLAGPEIAVATTKAYSAQLIACDALAIALALARGCMDGEEGRRLMGELAALPDKMRALLEDKERVRRFALRFAGTKDVFFIGRGLDYAVCMEGSLKMKEICYIHSEAYAAGELKHGTISLIEEGTPVIGVAAQQALREKTLSSLAEVKSRGARLAVLDGAEGQGLEGLADFVLRLPPCDGRFAPSLAAIPLQLLAYYISVNRGLDVDKPRNLAKSVTVE